MTRLVNSKNIEKYDKVYQDGYDKSYPNLDLVRLEAWFFNNQPGNTLDYGAGTGVNGIHLLEKGYDVTFMDASSESVGLIKEKLAFRDDIKNKNRAKTLLVAPESQLLPFEDDTFDYIICMSVLSLLETRERITQLIDEFYRILKPSGKMIVDINGPESDFSTKGKFINDETFEYKLHNDNNKALTCYCPKTTQTFRKLLDRFYIDDIGYVSFNYCGHDSNEFLALVSKPSVQQTPSLSDFDKKGEN